MTAQTTGTGGEEGLTENTEDGDLAEGNAGLGGTGARSLQLFAGLPGCFSTMKTLLKILLAAALLLIAIKLSPILFIGALIGLFVAGVLGVVGLSLVVALLAVALAFALALSPIWVPVLAIVGLVALFKRNERNTPPPVAA